MPRTRLISAWLPVAVVLLLPSLSFAQPFSHYAVTLNLNGLPATGASGYRLDYQFTDPTGGVSNNQAFVDNFTSTFGALGATNATVGTVGTLPTGFTIFDSITPSNYNQNFTGAVPPATGTVTFEVLISQNLEVPPDSFNFNIQDSAGVFIDTTAPGNASLFQLVLNTGGTPTLVAFTGQGAFAGVTISIQEIPEPASYLLFGLALSGVVGYNFQRRRKASMLANS